MSTTKIRIGDLFEVEKGSLQSSKNAPGDYDFITAAETWKTNETYSHECEALVFAAAASGSLGRTHYVNGKFIASDLCFILTPKDLSAHYVDLKFYHFVFNNLREKIVKSTKTGTSKDSINITNFSNYELPWLIEDEQNFWIIKLRKAEVIQNDLLEIIQQQQTYLQQLRQSIIQEAIEGKLTYRIKGEESIQEDKLEELRKKYQSAEGLKNGKKNFSYKPSDKIDLNGRTKGIDKLFEIPKNWRWISLGQITWNISDGPHFSPKYTDNGIPIISSRNISLTDGLDFSTAKYVSLEDYNEFIKRGKPEAGDILYTKGGTTGVPAIVESDREFCVWVHVALLKIIKEAIDPYFFKLVLSSSLVYNQSQKQTHGTGNKDLGLTRMTFIAFPLPPLPEQHRVVARVKQLLEMVRQLEQQIQQNEIQAQQLLQAVLKEAFSSKAKVYEENELLTIAAEE